MIFSSCVTKFSRGETGSEGGGGKNIELPVVTKFSNKFLNTVHPIIEKTIIECQFKDRNSAKLNFQRGLKPLVIRTVLITLTSCFISSKHRKGGSINKHALRLGCCLVFGQVNRRQVRTVVHGHLAVSSLPRCVSQVTA